MIFMDKTYEEMVVGFGLKGGTMRKNKKRFFQTGAVKLLKNSISTTSQSKLAKKRDFQKGRQREQESKKGG